METARNDFCCVCGEFAAGYAITGTGKTLVCSTHMRDMQAKGIAIYKFDADPVIDKRRDEVTRAKFFLQQVETVLHQEVASTTARLDASKATLTTVLAIAYEELKWTLQEKARVFLLSVQELSSQLDAYLQNQESSLSGDAALVASCKQLDFSSVLSITIYDPRMELIQQVVDSMHVENVSLDKFLRNIRQKDRSKKVSEIMKAPRGLKETQVLMKNAEVVLEFYSNDTVQKTIEILKSIQKALLQRNNADSLFLIRHVCDIEEIKDLTHSLLDSAKKEFWAGDIQSAQQSAERALPLLTLRLPRTKQRVSAELLLGRIFAIGLRKIDEAGKRYEEAMVVCREEFPVSTAFVECCEGLAHVLIEKNQISRSKELLELGLSLAKEKFPESLALAKLYRTYAFLHRKSSSFSESIELNRKSLALCMEIAPGSPDSIVSCVHLGLDLWRQGQHREASEVFLRGAMVMPQCSYTVACHVYLCQMLKESGKMREAEAKAWSAVCIGTGVCPKSAFTLMASNAFASFRRESAKQD